MKALEKVKKESLAIPNKTYRLAMLKLEKAMRESEGYRHKDYYPLNHTFAEGLYIRRLLVPKGHLVMSYIHKCSYPLFLLAGDSTVIQPSGNKRIRAPQSFISEAGVQRLVYSHVDSVWATVHTNPDNERDIDKIEERIYARHYDTFIEVGEDELDLIEHNEEAVNAKPLSLQPA